MALVCCIQLVAARGVVGERVDPDAGDLLDEVVRTVVDGDALAALRREIVAVRAQLLELAGLQLEALDAGDVRGSGSRACNKGVKL